MARSRTSARPVVVGAVLVLAAALSGCSATNDITSQSVYSASDGVRATLGDLTAENLLIVAEAADAPGALQGALTNRGDDALTVELSLEGSTERVRVESGATVLLGGGPGEGGADGDTREQVVFDTAGGAPGSTVELTLRTDVAGEQTVPAPVLDGTLPEYADLVPEPAAESPEPTATGTASAEDTTGPGAEATAEATAGTEG